MKKVRLQFAAKITLISTLIWGIWILVTNRLIGAFNRFPLHLKPGHIDRGWLIVLAIAALIIALLKIEAGTMQLFAMRNLRRQRIVAVANLVDVTEHEIAPKNLQKSEISIAQYKRMRNAGRASWI